MDITALKTAVETLGRSFAELGRLQAICSFFQPRLDERNQHSCKYVSSFDTANRLFYFSEQHFRTPQPDICWSDETSNGLNLSGGSVTETAANEAAKMVQSKAFLFLECLRRRLDPVLHGQLLDLLASIAQSCAGAGNGAGEQTGELHWRAISPVHRRFRAPPIAELDPVFVRTYSLTLEEATHLGAGVEVSDRAEKFWLTAMHEGLASRLCIVSLFEYDSLPLAFYCDMAKQASDEANHAVRFLAYATSLIEELSQADPQWRARLHAMRDRKPCLPVPFEGDFYEAIWAADLATRIVWMHIDTEGPGVGGLVALKQTPFISQRPAISRDLEFVIQDEITHAAMGRRWLKHLEYEHFLDSGDARLLRGLLLLGTVSINTGAPMTGLLKNYLQ